MAMTAHEVGLRFGGHVPADVGLEHAIEMGQETFDHLDGFIEVLNAFDEPIDRSSLDELVTMVKDAGAWVVPTLVLWDVGIIGRGDAQAMAGRPEMRYWPKRSIPGVVEGVEGWTRRHAASARERRRIPAQPTSGPTTGWKCSKPCRMKAWAFSWGRTHHRSSRYQASRCTGRCKRWPRPACPPTRSWSRAHGPWASTFGGATPSAPWLSAGVPTSSC